jgi:hypothetical protein
VVATDRFAGVLPGPLDRLLLLLAKDLLGLVQCREAARGRKCPANCWDCVQGGANDRTRGGERGTKEASTDQRRALPGRSPPAGARSSKP